MASSKNNMQYYVDMGTKVLSLIVIPMCLWVLKLEVDNAVRDQMIIQLEEEVEELQTVNSTVQKYAVQLGQVDQRLKSMEDTVHEIRQDIKDLLRREGP